MSDENPLRHPRSRRQAAFRRRHRFFRHKFQKPIRTPADDGRTRCDSTVSTGGRSRGRQIKRTPIFVTGINAHDHAPPRRRVADAAEVIAERRRRFKKPLTVKYIKNRHRGIRHFG